MRRDVHAAPLHGPHDQGKTRLDAPLTGVVVTGRQRSTPGTGAEHQWMCEIGRNNERCHSVTSQPETVQSAFIRCSLHESFSH